MRYLLNGGRSSSPTFSAVQILHEFTQAYTERGVGIHFAHLKPSHTDKFKIVGITDLVSHFATLSATVRAEVEADSSAVRTESFPRHAARRHEGD